MATRRIRTTHSFSSKGWTLAGALTAALWASSACTAADSQPEASPGGSGTAGSQVGGASSTTAGSGATTIAGSATSAGATGHGGSGGGTSGGVASGGTAGNGAGSPSTNGGVAAAGAPAGGSTSAAGGNANAGNANAGNANAGNANAGTGSTSDPVLHIFMLMGQSNMAGVAKREESDKNVDPRFVVWGGCNQPAGKWNVATPPLNDCPGEKGWNLSDTVDPGTWFGKTLLDKLPPGHTIGVVGTAESGESINTFITGGVHHQMILNKIAAVKGAQNARFEGIIFHQGESDSGQSTWPAKVLQLYNEVKAAFGVSYDVPFILGELPQGGCCAGHNTRVHEAADLLPKGAWVSQEGTKVLDQYHFDHASVVLMGKRYGDTMIKELGW